MTDYMQNRITYTCGGCGKIHHIELDEKLRLEIFADGETFVIFGAYKGHDENSVVIDTTMFLQFAAAIEVEGLEAIENPIVCVPWEDIEAFEQVENGHFDSPIYSA